LLSQVDPFSSGAFVMAIKNSYWDDPFNRRKRKILVSSFFNASNSLFTYYAFQGVTLTRSSLFIDNAQGPKQIFFTFNHESASIPSPPKVRTAFSSLNGLIEYKVQNELLSLKPRSLYHSLRRINQPTFSIFKQQGHKHRITALKKCGIRLSLFFF
jgi:hypothetical protein